MARLNLVLAVLELVRARYPDFEVDLPPRYRATRAQPQPFEPPPAEEPPRRRWRAWQRPRRSAAPRFAPPADPVLVASYAELGLPFGADLKEVRRAWKRLARQHHPDVHVGDPERERRSTERMQRLNSACEEIQRRLLAGTS